MARVSKWNIFLGPPEPWALLVLAVTGGKTGGGGPLQVGKGPGGSRPLWRVESWLLHPVGIE